MRMKWTGNVARLGIMKYVDTSGKKNMGGAKYGRVGIKICVKNTLWMYGLT